ncbi:hypothetical protein EYC58_00220 [Candidatus Saccharibacteria bacterium]|nr:MAG: hypothetical protein EYC58_00220 [Candidatus Saccharibacteria bacterium]
MKDATTLGNTDDYAIAREFHFYAIELLKAVELLNKEYNYDDPYAEYHETIMDINRPYVLLVNELEKIYEQNKALAKLNDDPKTKATWTLFNTIESQDQEIYSYFKEHKSLRKLINDADYAHQAQVNRLAILAGKETPNYSPKQQKIWDDAEAAFVKFVKLHAEWQSRRPKKKSKGHNFIVNYELKYADNGNIVINDVLILKKTQSGSAPRKLLEQAIKHPYEHFQPELGQLNRNLTNVLSDMGITGVLKELFFPIVNREGVTFRPAVYFQTADNEKIDTTELDKKLKELGASTETILDSNESKEPEEPMSEELRSAFMQSPEGKKILSEYDRNENERKTK